MWGNLTYSYPRDGLIVSKALGNKVNVKGNLGCKTLLSRIITLPLSKSVLPVKSHGFACLVEWFVFDLSMLLLSNFPLGAIFLSQSLLGDYDVSALSTFNMALRIVSREG